MCFRFSSSKSNNDFEVGTWACCKIERAKSRLESWLNCPTNHHNQTHLAYQITLPVSPFRLRSAVVFCAISISIVFSNIRRVPTRRLVFFLWVCNPYSVLGTCPPSSSIEIDRKSWRESTCPRPRKGLFASDFTGGLAWSSEYNIKTWLV